MKRTMVRAPFFTPRQTLTSGSPGTLLLPVPAFQDGVEIPVALVERKPSSRGMNLAAPLIIFAASSHKQVVDVTESLGHGLWPGLYGPISSSLARAAQAVDVVHQRRRPHAVGFGHNEAPTLLDAGRAEHGRSPHQVELHRVRGPAEESDAIVKTVRREIGRA